MTKLHGRLLLAQLADFHVLATRSQPRLSCLASANHLYPATKVAFQPSSLSTSSSSDRDRGYMSPSSKSAKRASWGANQGSPSPLVPNEESHDGYPNRELLASTADCLRIWECARNADSSVAPWESEEDEASYGGAGSGSNGYAGSRGRHANANGKTRFSLREKSVLAHVSQRERAMSTKARPCC